MMVFSNEITNSLFFLWYYEISFDLSKLPKLFTYVYIFKIKW